MNAFEYWRSKLSVASMGCYIRFLDAVKQRKSSVTLPGCDSTEVLRIFEALSYDHPELYWMSTRLATSAGSPIVSSFFGMKAPELNLAFPPIYSAAEMRSIDVAMNDAKAIALSFKSKDPLESIEKVIKYLASNVAYEINNDMNQNAASVFYYKKAQCSGIAKAFKYMLDAIKIPCIFVAGQANANGNAGPHAWNIVEIDGYCYHVDPTSIISNYTGQELLGHPLYMASDSTVSNTHSWDTSRVVPCRRELPQKTAFSKQCMDNWTDGSADVQADFVAPVGVTVSSLVEIRALIIQAMNGKSEGRIAFTANIDVDEDKLHKLVANTTVQALKSLNLRCPVINVKSRQKAFNIIVTQKNN